MTNRKTDIIDIKTKPKVLSVSHKKSFKTPCLYPPNSSTLLYQKFEHTAVTLYSRFYLTLRRTSIINSFSPKLLVHYLNVSANNGENKNVITIKMRK